MEKRYTLVMDYDGTIHDSLKIYEPAFRRAMFELEEKGWIEHKEYSAEEIAYWVGFSAAEMWMKFHPELSDEQREYASRLIGKYMHEAMNEGMAALYPGAEAVLDELKRCYNLIFLSNCDRGYMSKHIELFKLDKWFDEFFCTGDYGFAPKEQVFAEHIYREGVKYVAIGDRMKDIALAKNSGILGVGCLYGFGSREELAGADILVNSINELCRALAEL